MVLLLILTTIILSIPAFITFLWLRSHWKSDDIRQQYLKQRLPFVSIPSLLYQAYFGKRPDLIEFDLVQKHGKVFGSDLFLTKTIYVAEPELIQQIISKEFTSFTNRRKINFDDKIFSSFLSVTEDEKWKRIRSIVTPTFSTGKLRRMKPRIDDTNETLVKNFEKMLQKSDIINVKELYGAYTMDTIIQVAFGTKVDSLSDPNNKIISMAKNLFSKDLNLAGLAILSIMLSFPSLLTILTKYIKINRDLVDFFVDFSNKIIKQKREELKDKKNLGKANNFLELMLEAEAENEEMIKNGESLTNGVKVDENKNLEENQKKSTKFMTNDEMIAQCVLFFLAAYDTTTSTISMASYMLALNQSVQDRLYEEIDSKLKKLHLESGEQTLDSNKLVTFENLSQFEYLNAVVSETLRMYPPVSTERAASRDMTLESEDGSIKLNLKKDDVIRFPVYTIHRDPLQFPDPEKFDPERFLGETTFHKYSYMPFGNGPRNCVARSLALMEAKMAILNVIYRYRLSACAKTKIPVEFYNNGQILTPRDILLKVERR